MSYKLDRFASVDINLYDSTDDTSTADSNATLYVLAGGSLFDALGPDQAIALPRTITKSGQLIGTTRDAVYTLFWALRALRGKRGRLERVVFTGDDGEDRARQWTTARCMSINTSVGRTYAMQFYMPVTLEFQCLSPAWYGRYRSASGWVLDDGYILDDGLYLDDPGNQFAISAGANTDITLTNDGNENVTNAVITLTAGDIALTGVRIVGPDTNLYYGGTILPNTALVIDCGAFSVKNDGVGDYDNFTLDPSHASRYWLNLAPGDNAVSVQTAITGEAGEAVSSTIAITYWEPYA
jgi:hypothetical protein